MNKKILIIIKITITPTNIYPQHTLPWHVLYVNNRSALVGIEPAPSHLPTPGSPGMLHVLLLL
jgi:hypothetical protein